MTRMMRRFSSSAGLKCGKQEVFPNGPNVIAPASGPRSGAAQSCLRAHQRGQRSQVKKAWRSDPFEPRSRGASCMAAARATRSGTGPAMMHAVADTKEEGIVPPCEVWMAATVDEEFSYRGVVRLCGETKLRRCS